MTGKQHEELRKISEMTDYEVDEDAAKKLPQAVILPTKKHWLWSNWIALSIAAMISFSVCNIFIGQIAQMGIKGVFYFNSGSLLLSILYFLYQREWRKLNHGPKPGLLDRDRKKVLLRTWETNKFDWISLLHVFIGAAFQTAIFASIAYTFKMA